MANDKQGFPDDRDNELRRQAEKVHASTEDLVDWVARHAEARNGTEHAISPEQDAELLDLRRRAASLVSSVRIPVAAAIYGASQVGKSLFVGQILEPADIRDSPLGQSEQGPPAYFQELSFRHDINPQSGSNEATALVTRFTTKERFGASLPRYPVKVRALTRAEWLCVMARGYRSECQKHSEVAPWAENQIRELFEEIHRGHAASSAQADRTWRRDLLDVYTHLRGVDDLLFPIKESMFNFYLNKYPLTDSGYVELAGRMFWDSRNFPSLTLFFCEICRFLEKIRAKSPDPNSPHQRDGILVHWAAVRFLLDSQRSDKHENKESKWRGFEEVKWKDLVTRVEDGWYVLDYDEGKGPPTEDLAVIQSAMLEMIIPVSPHRLKEDWRNAILKMDILDLPGMRAGGGKAGAEAISTLDEKMNVVKRGKVAYLFDRYIEERHVQTLLLLVKGGNLEVRQSLKEYIVKWLSIRYGKAGFRKAAGAFPALFIGLTGIDEEFKDRSPATSLYDARLKTLVTETLGKVMTDFGGPGIPFTNVYPIRYPGSWDCDETQRTEKQRPPGAQKKWQEAREIFLNSEMVKKYVGDPQQRWDVAMQDNDGGLSLISHGFLECTTSLQKQDALQDEIRQVSQALRNLANGWHCDPDANQDRDKRAALAKRVIDWLVDDGKAYQRVWALKEALSFQPDDVLEIAEHNEGPLSRQLARPESRDTRFPAVLKIFLERWARELAPRRWSLNTADPSGGPWLSTDEVSLFARYLSEYLCLTSDFDGLVARLQELIKLPVSDENDRRRARREYVRLILNDHVLNPGADDSPVEPPSGHGPDCGLMQPFIERWQSRLAAKLSSAAGVHKVIPAGNDELKPFLSDTIL